MATKTTEDAKETAKEDPRETAKEAGPDPRLAKLSARVDTLAAEVAGLRAALTDLLRQAYHGGTITDKHAVAVAKTHGLTFPELADA